MSALSKIFKVSSIFAMAGWLLLVVLPSWQYSQFIVVGIIVTLLSFIYTYLIIFGKRLDAPGYKSLGNFSSLQGVMDLFKSPRAVLAGWIHYLAFDLFIGLFIVSNAAHYDISHWLLVPCLLLALMFGPAGLLLYFVIRFAVTQDYMAVNFF
jgi:hypothetical protein